MEITFSSQKSLDTNPIFKRFVQGENLAEKIEIKGPKMLGALDLSQLNMAIRVSSEKYETTVEKPMQQKTEDDQVILTWTVDKDFTAVPGHVNVSVIGYGAGQDEEIIKITSDGIEVKPDDLQGTTPPENQWPQILREMQGYANSAQANADKAEAAADRAEAVPTDLQHFVDDAAAAAKSAEKSAEEAAASAESIDTEKLINTTGGKTGQIPRITENGYEWTEDKVNSVNGKTGAVTLGAEDVKARPDSWTPTAAEVGAIPKDNAKTLASGITWGSGSTLTPDGWDDYAIIQLSSNYGRAIIRRLPKNGSTFALFASNTADYINITCVTVTRNSTGGSLALSILTSLRLSTSGITKNVTEFNIYQIDGLV